MRVHKEHPEKSQYQNAEYWIKHWKYGISERGDGVSKHTADGGNEIKRIPKGVQYLHGYESDRVSKFLKNTSRRRAFAQRRKYKRSRKKRRI